jgi:hypothetical protein
LTPPKAAPVSKAAQASQIRAGRKSVPEQKIRNFGLPEMQR